MRNLPNLLDQRNQLPGIVILLDRQTHTHGKGRRKESAVTTVDKSFRMTA